MMDPFPDNTGGGDGDVGGEGFHSKVPVKICSRLSPHSQSQSEFPVRRNEGQQSEQERPILRGSSSYPTMIRARTANRNKITKRNSESSVILTGGGCSSKALRSDSTKRRNPPHKKKSVYSRATRRKSLENLGLIVRNRCGSAKIQWPAEKKETDVFDLLSEGCLQVRQLRMKTAMRGSLNSGRDLEMGWKGNGHFDDEANGNIPFPIRVDSNVGTGPSSGRGSNDWKSKRSISVIVRIRPKQHREITEKSIVFRSDPKTIIFDPKEKTKDFYFQGVKQSTRSDFGRKRPNRNVCFQYDKVYGPEATNKHIFSESLQDLTDHLIDGFNSTVFAYGATGSGKTFTMIGSNSNPGLIVLMVESLYKKIGELGRDYDCDVVCSYLEVYNETIKDLLKPEKELYIREDGKKGIIIPELTFYKPRGPNELLRLLRNGNRARTQHATDLNAESSRSHAVFEVRLCLKRKSKEARNELCEEEVADLDEEGLSKVEVIQSKLVMVDLAGSERAASAALASSLGNINGSGFFMDGGARQREGASINKSLLALANCISALADGRCHIPFRNSKLTRLLKDALSGNCTTIMIANVSPSTLSSEDTYNTLKYADRAKNIVGPETKRNVVVEDLNLEETTKVELAEMQERVTLLTEQLEEEKLNNEVLREEIRKLQQSRERERENSLNFIINKNKKMGGKGGNLSRARLGGGDADDFHSDVKNVKGNEEDFEYNSNSEEDIMEEVDNKEFPIQEGKTVSEENLPEDVQKYLELFQKRARVYTEYVQFASDLKLSEWTLSCKKLKADIADFLGRLSVSDENYVSFCKLKNEVNSLRTESRSSSSSSSELVSTHVKNSSALCPHSQHKKYAMKLKNLTEKLELVRLECVANNLLSLPDEDYIIPPPSPQPHPSPHLDRGKLQPSPPLLTVAISLEEFIQFKRLLGEQEGNDRMEQFYQQFSQQINGQLITSGMTLMHALKLVKRLESIRHETNDGGGSAVQQDYKDLYDLVYGSGSRANVLDCNNNSSRNTFPPLGRPQTTSASNLGRRSNLILEDLQKLRKMAEQPLLIQLTSLLGAEDEDEDTDETDENCEELRQNNPKYTYRLESPSMALQQYSQSHADNRDEDESSNTDKYEKSDGFEEDLSSWETVTSATSAR